MEGWEPFDLYRKLAGHVREIVLNAAEIHSGKVSDTEWNARFPNRGHGGIHGIGAAMDGIALRAGMLVQIAEVRLGLQTLPKFHIEIQFDSVLGALAIQALLVAANSSGIYACDGCGHLYERRGRAPNSTDRNFCSSCGTPKAHSAAKVRYRRTIARAQHLAKEGQTISEIAKILDRPKERIKTWVEKGVVV